MLSQLSIDWVASNKLNSINSKTSELNLAKKLAKNLTKSDFGQWYPVTYFSRKMIPAETRNKTHNAELLAIVKALKT